MAVKAILFVVIACLAAAVVLVRDPSWTTAACLLAIAWAASRAYYFAFYVVEKYVDPTFRFAGLGAFCAWWLRRHRRDR
jgi:hypothetical protein